MICKKCQIEKHAEFYGKDSTCKDCRKAAVRANRAAKADHYREYDRNRFKNDPKVRERHRRYHATERGKSAAASAKKRWQETNPIKRAANVMVGNALRKGVLRKPGFCSECRATGRIHGHHDDYAKPLEVRWLCSACHKKWHKENGEGMNA